MSAAPRPSLLCASLGSFLLALALLGCGSSLQLTVRPGEPAPLDTVIAPKLGESAYRKVLLLPPEGGVDTSAAKVEAVRDQKVGYYTAKLEKLLLAKGFEVISPEIVARADSELRGKGGSLSAAEKAMVLGQKTKADAVLVVQGLKVRSAARYFQVDEDRTLEVDPARVRHDEDEEHPLHEDTEHCLHEVPYYEVVIETKMLDASSGTVLWVGSGRASTIDVMRDSWVADVDDGCEVLSQSFDYGDELAAEATLDRTSSALFERLLAPLAKTALAGKSLEPAPPPPPPAPPVVEAPKTQTAIVSSSRAALREGAGKRNPRLKDVPRKAKVEVLETMGEWLKVKLQDGTVGWMHESTLIVNE